MHSCRLASGRRVTIFNSLSPRSTALATANISWAAVILAWSKRSFSLRLLILARSWISAAIDEISNARTAISSGWGEASGPRSAASTAWTAISSGWGEASGPRSGASNAWTAISANYTGAWPSNIDLWVVFRCSRSVIFVIDVTNLIETLND